MIKTKTKTKIEMIASSVTLLNNPIQTIVSVIDPLKEGLAISLLKKRLKLNQNKKLKINLKETKFPKKVKLKK